MVAAARALIIGALGVGTILISGCEDHAAPAPAQRVSASAKPPPPPRDPRPARAAPANPRTLGSADRPRVVLMTAKWCQWCRVLEHEVLPAPRVKRVLSERYQLLEADVDAEPAWMDLPGVEGLPTFAFFDMRGRHVLSRSGYRTAPALTNLLEVVAGKIERGEIDPYPEKPAGPSLAAKAITKERAAAAAKRFESRIFIKVNSNNGGFHTPARHPYPDLMRELQEWVDIGTAPARVSDWVRLTVEGALRGGSPRLRGKPLDDMSFDGAELVKLARDGPDAGDRWRAGLDLLHDQDPWLGLQDPVDHGVFRYAAGAGWYNPHFERRASDNLSWVLLLRARHRIREAQAISSFVEKTFSDEGLLNAVQRANPYYYRLSAVERKKVPSPRVARLWALSVQARGARTIEKRCRLLLRVRGDRWPRELWTASGEDDASPDATPDAVGELLLGLSACRGDRYEKLAAALGDTVVAAWQRGPIATSTKPTRLHRLAAGLCAVGHPSCGRALASVAELPLDLDFAPPLSALARF